MSDIEIAWPLILGSILGSMVLGFVYMVLMRYATGPMVWACIFVYFVAVAGLAYIFHIKGKEYRYNFS